MLFKLRTSCRSCNGCKQLERASDFGVECCFINELPLLGAPPFTTRPLAHGEASFHFEG